MKRLRTQSPPKRRNPHAVEVRDGTYQPKTERDRSKYQRKPKHRNTQEDY